MMDLYQLAGSSISLLEQIAGRFGAEGKTAGGSSVTYTLEKNNSAAEARAHYLQKVRITKEENGVERSATIIADLYGKIIQFEYGVPEKKLTVTHSPSGTYDAESDVDLEFADYSLNALIGGAQRQLMQAVKALNIEAKLRKRMEVLAQKGKKEEK